LIKELKKVMNKPNDESAPVIRKRKIEPVVIMTKDRN
jgi:hypothetical protein